MLSTTKSRGVINPREIAKEVAEILREDLAIGPFVTSEEAARILRIKFPRNIPKSIPRYYRGGKEGKPLFKRDEVIGAMLPKA